MKRNQILGLVIAISILAVILTIGFITHINKQTDELLKLEKEYSKLEEENANLKSEINNMETNIYNMFEKKPYELHVTHNDEHITYKQDKFGIFDSYTKMSTKILGIDFQ